jgi:hypothetical protein
MSFSVMGRSSNSAWPHKDFLTANAVRRSFHPTGLSSIAYASADNNLGRNVKRQQKTAKDTEFTMALIKSLAFLAVFCRFSLSPNVPVLLVEQVAQKVSTYQPELVVIPLSTTPSQPSLPVKPVTQRVSTLQPVVVPVTRLPSEPSLLAETLAKNGSVSLPLLLQRVVVPVSFSPFMSSFVSASLSNSGSNSIPALLLYTPCWWNQSPRASRRPF